MPVTPLIEAVGLTRRFDQRLAVDSLSFTLRAGQVLALLGPNGAGKTTTMRMLCGLLAPTSGSARICGHPLATDERENDQIRALCGIVPEASGFYERLSALDNLRFFGGLQGLSRREVDARSTRALARFGLSERGGDRTSTYSKGMKQRLSLARALLHEPRLLFLDEPMAGLDPQAAADLHGLIRELQAAGTGIVLSTHSLEEAEDLADEVLVMSTRMLFQGPPADLAADDSTEVEIALTLPLTMPLMLPAEIRQLATGATILRFTVTDPARDIPHLVRVLVAAGGDIVHVGGHRRGLRERYLKLLGTP